MERQEVRIVPSTPFAALSVDGYVSQSIAEPGLKKAVEQVVGPIGRSQKAGRTRPVIACAMTTAIFKQCLHDLFLQPFAPRQRYNGFRSLLPIIRIAASIDVATRQKSLSARALFVVNG